MTKQEIALLNFAQRISTGYLTVAIGDKLSFGEPTHDLKLRLRKIQQLNKLFSYEYGKPDSESDNKLLYSIVLEINTLLNNYRLGGTYTVNETEIAPAPAQYADLIILNEGPVANVFTIVDTQFEDDKVTYKNPQLVNRSFNISYAGNINGGSTYDRGPLLEGTEWERRVGGGFKLLSTYVALPGDVFQISNVSDFVVDGSGKQDLSQKNKPGGYVGTSRVAYRTTIEELREYTGDLISDLFYVSDKGKEGNWYYDALDITTVDNLGTTLVTTDGKRIKRIFDDVIDARWFGAIADYDYATNTGTDNTVFIQNAINYIFSIGGATLYFPTGKYFVTGTIYINELVAPLTIKGAVSKNRNYSANRIIGASIIKNNAGDLFRINMKADGSSFLKSNEQYPSFSMQGLNFQCKNGYIGGTNVFNAFRFRGKFEDISVDGFDYFMLQKNSDINGVANYCDQSMFTDIRISASTFAGIRLFAADATKLSGISFEGSATQYKFGIEVLGTDGVAIADVVYSSPNDFVPIVGSSFIQLRACGGVNINDIHLENSMFENYFHVETCVGVNISEITSKFRRYDGVRVLGGSLGVKISNWYSNEVLKPNSYDINAGGVSDEGIVYENCYFFDFNKINRRPIFNNILTKTSTVYPAYVPTYITSSDQNLTLRRSSTCVFLGSITANRTLTMPIVDRSLVAEEITIINRNDSAFEWTLTESIREADGKEIFLLESNRVYTMVFAQGLWRIKSKYHDLYTYFTATNADYNLTLANSVLQLPSITADRTLTIPTAVANTGRTIKFIIRNESSSNWIPSVPFTNFDGTQMTTLPRNATIEIVSAGTSWRISSYSKFKSQNVKFYDTSVTIILNNSGLNARYAFPLYDIGSQITTVVNGKTYLYERITSTTWAMFSATAPTLLVDSVTDIVNLAFLNTTYPIATYPIETTIIYFNQGKEYKRMTSTVWTEKATTLTV